MKQEIQAVYQNGALHPLEPLALGENEQVALTIHSADEQWLDSKAQDRAAPDGDTASTLATNRWRDAKLPIHLRVYEGLRRLVGLPKSLAALNYELDANRELVHQRAAANTERLTGNRHI